MKKTISIFLITIFLFLLTACKKYDNYTNISYIKYLEKLNNKETFPLVIGSESCSACALYEGTMKTFMKKNHVEVYFIDLEQLTEEEYNNLKLQTSFDGTPTTIFIKDGELTSFYNRINGTTNLSTVETYFKNNGYLK